MHSITELRNYGKISGYFTYVFCFCFRVHPAYLLSADSIPDLGSSCIYTGTPFFPLKSFVFVVCGRYRHIGTAILLSLAGLLQGCIIPTNLFITRGRIVRLGSALLHKVCNQRMQVLINLEDYSSVGTPENLALTVVAVFVGLWIYQLAAFLLYSCFGGELFGPLKYRTIFARHTMDLTSMVIFCYMGFEGLEQLGGTFTSVHSLILSTGKIAAIGAERSFFFSSAAQRLCVWQIAYEAKNFCDSVIHNDGVIFLVHHTATGLLAVRSACLHILPFFFAYYSNLKSSLFAQLH